MRSALLAFLAITLLQTGCGSTDKPGGGTTGGSGGSPDSGGSGGSSATGGKVGTGGSTGGSSGGTGGTGGTAQPDAATTAADAGVGTGGSSGGDTGPAADTWDSFAKAFFTSYCVSCHNDDNKGATRDYHLLATVMTEKTRIACGVATPAEWSKRGCTAPAARQFPVGSGPKPTDAERDRLVRWIDSGTP